MVANTALATNPGTGLLNDIDDCYLSIPVPAGTVWNGNGPAGMINFNNLPDISDAKSANYSPENIPGRSYPIHTFVSGEDRSISLSVSLFSFNENDILKNLQYLAAIKSAVYPRAGSSALPFYPPPICQLKCGSLLSSQPLCVIMKDYSIKFPTDMPWHPSYMLPSRVEVSMNFVEARSSSNLPGQEMVIKDY